MGLQVTQMPRRSQDLTIFMPPLAPLARMRDNKITGQSRNYSSACKKVIQQSDTSMHVNELGNGPVEKFM